MRPYKTEGGEELLILQEGIRSPAEVFWWKQYKKMSFNCACFRTEQNNNRTQTWLYRLGGWLALFLGLTLLRWLLENIWLCVQLGFFLQSDYPCSQVLELALDLVPRLRQVLALQIGSLPFSVSITLSLGIIGEVHVDWHCWTFSKDLAGSSSARYSV